MATVTVVVPLYNGSRHVAETITGILQQTFVDFELVVVDDGSTDDSADFVARIIHGESRARLIGFPNGGLTAARQRGLEAASGQFIAFLDQDDIWYPELLSRLVSTLQSCPRLSAAGCLMQYINDDGRPLGRTAQTPRTLDQGMLRRGQLVQFPVSSTVFRTAAIRASNATEDLFGTGLASGSDLSLLARTAQEGEMVAIREVLGARRMHQGSTMARSHLEIFAAAAYVRAVMADPSYNGRMPWPNFLASYTPPRREARYQKAIVRYRQGGVHLIDRQWRPALLCFVVALWYRPDYVVRRAWSQVSGD